MKTPLCQNLERSCEDLLISNHGLVSFDVSVSIDGSANKTDTSMGASYYRYGRSRVRAPDFRDPLGVFLEFILL